jgi:hypothetical protein
MIIEVTISEPFNEYDAEGVTVIAQGQRRVRIKGKKKGRLFEKQIQFQNSDFTKKELNYITGKWVTDFLNQVDEETKLKKQSNG